MKLGFNRIGPSDAQAELLSRLGHDAIAIGDDASGASGCDIVFLAGRTAPEIRDEVFGSDGLAARLTRGTVLVDRSDSDPGAARTLSRAVDDAGLGLVEAPVSGHYTHEAGLAPVTFLAGAAQAREVVRPLLPGAVLDCGAAGNGHATNLFNATMGLTAYLASLEVAAMGAKFGLSLDAMAEVISKGSGRNRASTIAMPRMMAGDPATDMSLARALGLIELTTAAARAGGVPMVLPNIACGLLQAAVNRYGPGASLERAVDLVESMSGARLHGQRSTPSVHATGDASDLKVGYLGVGTMGGALARRLMLSRPVMVHDVNPRFVEALGGEGATAAPDAATLARDCDVVMICVPTSAIVRQAIFGPGGLAEGLSPGKIVIDQTTGSPSETRAIARDLGRIGVEMIDAPVSGGTRGAVAGTIAIIGGGPREVFARVRPILEQLSPNIVYCGDIGNGHAAKLVQNATAACNRVMTLECAAAAVRSGLRLDSLVNPIEAGAGWNGGAARILPALREGQPTTDFAMGLMVKDLRLAMDIGNELSAPMLIANAARALMQTCANEEGADANLDAIARTVETMSGLVFSESG